MGGWHRAPESKAAAQLFIGRACAWRGLWAQCQPLPGLALGLEPLLRRLRYAAPISRVLPSPSTGQGVEQGPSAAYGVMSVSTT
jgi:hypothetical protein